jgi:hypothetical protein
MLFAVYVDKIRDGESGPSQRSEVLQHRSKLAGIVDHPAHPLQLLYSETTGVNFLLDRNGAETHPLSRQLNEIRTPDPCYLFHGSPDRYCEPGGGTLLGYRYEVGAYTEAIQLEKYGIGIGDDYQILYYLVSEAGEDYAEHYAESFIADPLDNDGGGLVLTTEHTPISTAAQVCDETPDAGRFQDHNDGSITDTRTSLMWERCPAGFELNDNGTLDDQNDDSCSPGTILGGSWQSALQTAVNDNTGAYNDWRLPNVKELASLVTPGCQFLATDRLAFPDTPPRHFWTSTPFASASDEASWSVNFLSGDASPVLRSGYAYARHVRDTGTAPVLPRPAIRAMPAFVDEGPAGSTAMLEFSVVMSHPIGETVTIDYRTEAQTASDVDPRCSAIAPAWRGSGSRSTPSWAVSPSRRGSW